MRILFRPLVCLFILLSFDHGQAGTTAKTIIDLVRETPANVTGLISLDETLQVYKTKKLMMDVDLKVNGNEQIGFEVSEHHLKIMPDKAITLSVAGLSVPITVSELYYEDKINRFTLRTKSSLPRLIENSINTRIENILNETYRPKVIQAFKELQKVRSSQDKNDIQKVVQSISNIFSSEHSKAPLPTVRGEVNLNLHPVKDQRLTFGDWNVDVKGNDNLAVGAKFVKGPEKISIKGVEISSKAGLRFSGKTSIPEIVSLVAFDLNLQESGPDIRYSIGAEEVIAGYQQVIGLFGTISGQPVSPESCDCKEFKLTPIRETINKDLRFQLSKFVKAYRETLLEKGISPELIRALE